MPSEYATDRTVVVTGASAGAGRAIAELFAREGWRVALLARHGARLAAVQEAITQAGGTAQEYQRVTEVTYLGYVYGTLAAFEHTRPRGGGVIVQVGSALAYRAIPVQSAYCAAKFAIRGFTDALRTELRYTRSRVRVTMVQMPALNTPQFDWARNKFAHKYRPVGTVYQPEVAARAVLRAMQQAPREFWVGWSTIRTILGQLVAPGLLDRLAAREAWQPQLTDIPERVGRPENLFATVPGPYGAHGRFDAESEHTALMVSPQRAWWPVAAVASLGAAAWIARRYRRSIRNAAKNPASASWARKGKTFATY